MNTADDWKEIPVETPAQKELRELTEQLDARRYTTAIRRRNPSRYLCLPVRA